MAVRRESVRIDVDSNLAQVAARDAAAVQLLARNLDSLGRSGVQSDRSTQRVNRTLSETASSSGKAAAGLRQVADAADGTDGSSRRMSNNINNLTGRIRLLADVAAILGPALVPVGALAVPAVTGLANQLGFAAAAGGTALLAFQGVGDAVTAMNEYALEPTAENLAKVEQQLSYLSPQAAEFARGIGDMRDTFIATRDAAAEGLFPGLTRGLDDLDGLLGRLQPVLTEIGAATGDMLADGLESLNSDRWQPFFDFLQAEARPVLTELGATVGDFGHGLAELWMAFQPLNSDFSGWLRRIAGDFDGWAASLSQTDGFNDFVAYLRESGPQVASAMSALGGALLDIAVAAAPLGGPVLAGLKAFANVVSAIAESPIGPPLVAAASAMALLNRAMSAQAYVSAGGFFPRTAANVQALAAGFGDAEKRARGFRGAISGLGRAAGPLAGLALASSDLGDSFALSNTATLGLMGSFAGLPGAIGGAAIGAILDAAAAGDDFTAAFERAENALQSGSLEDQQRELSNLKGTLDDTRGSVGAMWSDFISPLTGDSTFNQLEVQADRLRQSIDRTRDPASGLAGVMGSAFGMSADAINEATQSADAFHESLLSINDALQGRASMRDYEAALDDLTASVKEHGKTLNTDTEAGRANQQTLDNIAATSLTVAEGLTGMERRRFLVRAREDFIDAAQKLGKTEKGARRLADELGLLGRKSAKPKVDLDGAPATRTIDSLMLDLMTLDATTVSSLIKANPAPAGAAIGGILGMLGVVDRRVATPSVVANTAGAASAIGGVIGMLGNIRDKSVTVTTFTQTIALGVTAGGRTGRKRAYGGPVIGEGTDRSDNILTPTSPGEWVMQAPAVRMYGQAFMDDINNMRLSRRQMEREGVMAAMRAPARQSVNVSGAFRAFLDTSDGRRITMDMVDQRIEDRIQDYRDADDDYAHSQSQRVVA